MNRFTDMPLTYQMGDYTGDNWLIAAVHFYATDEEGKEEIGHIVTDHVHIDELDYGEPEADLRLWANARRLLNALENLLKNPNRELYIYEAKAAIRSARGEPRQ